MKDWEMTEMIDKYFVAVESILKKNNVIVFLKLIDNQESVIKG